MFRNLNPVAFQKFGSILSERKNGNIILGNDTVLTLEPEQTTLPIYQAGANTYLRLNRGKSILSVSDDGENWGDRIGGDVPTDDTSSVNGVYELAAGASGRYVQFRFTSTGWAFISEVEVYGVAE